MTIRTSAFKSAALIGFIVCCIGSTRADDIKVPTDPVARAAFDMLEKHCARCHQQGRLTARERPSRDFGNILKLDELAANPKYVVPGNPSRSAIFKWIVDIECPFDVVYEGANLPAPSQVEIAALEAWIKRTELTNTKLTNSTIILDPSRNLMWAGALSASEFSIEDALEYVKNLEINGLRDWRLPTEAELESLLIKPAVSDEPDAANFPFREPFNVYRRGHVHSGTRVPGQEGHYYIMNLRNGHIFNGHGYKGFVRAVRDLK